MLKRCQQTFWHKSRIETRFPSTSFSMIEEKITLLFFWSSCYFSNAGRSNYSSYSTFDLFCLLSFTNNYGFRPRNLLLNCRFHPHCFSFLESKEGTVRWTTPYPLVSMRETPSNSRTAFFALCYYWLLPLWCTPWLRRLWPACSCAWTMTVAVYSTSRICPSRFMSWLSGAEGGEQAFGRHGRPVAIAGWCSARATSCFWDIPFICCKNKLGIGISLD